MSFATRSARASWIFLAASLFALSTGVTGCAAEDGEDVGEVELAKKKKDNKKDDDKKDDDKPADPPKPKDIRRFEVLQHNLGGGTENDAGAAGIAYTFSRIDDAKPDVVLLEEVCAAQYELFKQRYPTWSVLWAQMTSNEGNDRCGGTPKGQLLASPRAMAEEIRKDLGESDGERTFTLLCGGVPVPDTQRSVLACVTHLIAGKEETAAAREKQAWRIADTLNPFARDGRAVVIGGDLNTNPDGKALDHLYRLTRNGQTDGGKFDEADQTDPNRERYAQRDGVQCTANACRTGEGTMGANRSKLDYIFFSHNRVVELGAEVDNTGGSAHKLYRGWAKLEF